MASNTEIKCGKILVKEIFSNMWFRIPEYQRPYVWGYEEINELLDDLTFAMRNKPNSEYFLGSFVFQTKLANPILEQDFDENDLLDGQQRMITLLLLFAIIRDLAYDPDAKEDCQKCIYQKASKYKEIPERTRLVFSIRNTAQDFIDSYVIPADGTSKHDELKKKAQKAADISIQNMANAIIEIRNFFKDNTHVEPEKLLHFLLNNVLFIYVSTQDLEDAFRLFTILNDRGIPLRNSDILKSINLGELEDEEEKKQYAKLWEEAEGELGDDFDRFLNHVRTVLVKEKPRLNLLQEFEEKIYFPKEREKSTGKPKNPLLKKGKETFVLVEQYLSYYKDLLGGQNHDFVGNWSFDNLIKVMLNGLPATDWIPPLLRYFDKFKEKEILKFLINLDNKFSAGVICQETPTNRIETMNKVIKVIDKASKHQDVLASNCFNFDTKAFKWAMDGPIYKKRFSKYILLKLDYLYQNQDQKMHFETLSVEHILPQNPKANSQWENIFTSTERMDYLHKIGNLILITRRKNTTLGRLDYQDKKKKYFEKNIDTCPNSLRVLQKYSQWTPHELLDNQEIVLDKLYKHCGIV